MKNSTRTKLMMVSAMIIFGTIGVFVKYIPLPSSVIALARSTIGTIFLLILTIFRKNKLNISAIRNNVGKLLLLGIFLGANWILLFEAYRYTSVAVATLCYYLAPVFVVLCSPIIGERLTVRKLVFSAIALFGMVLISGVGGGEVSAIGLVFGVLAAVLYASIVLINKRLRDISSSDVTIAQLGISAVVVGVYVILTEDFSQMSIDWQGWLLLLTVGVVHTGLAYSLYFAAVKLLSAQASALFAYIDPVCAIILSALFLSEPMSVATAIGAVLILGSTITSELLEK